MTAMTDQSIVNPSQIQRLRKCVEIIEGYGHFSHGQDGYQALLEVRQFFDRLAGKHAPYGFCPHCGEPGQSRERRPNGNDRCPNGHVYPASAATPRKPSGDMTRNCARCGRAFEQGGPTPWPLYPMCPPCEREEPGRSG